MQPYLVQPSPGPGGGIGAILLRQLRQNLLGLGIPALQTEVAWRDTDLLAFFQRSGFQPAPRLCLDLDLQRARRADEVLAEEPA